eukprot:TRINITY_DN14459_c0_g1_i1.p1 TRINITY_DN14459_c0_g1~~TRINITY_DN14459_c0_g1_i1.p1  ORF type:complete len:119 (-),score=17.45 TRINITY_DN14459_c0_g1_i1:101-457(-)
MSASFQTTMQSLHQTAGADRYHRLLAAAAGDQAVEALVERMRSTAMGRVWSLEDLPRWLWEVDGRPVARRSALQLSCEAFNDQFDQPQLPVLLTDAHTYFTDMTNWRVETMAEQYRDV